MIKCPYCKNEIPDDSRYCDQCGKAVMYCPECGVPKKGTECAACGETLVSAEQFRSKPKTVQDTAWKLEGEGLSLTVTEGSFGRRGGIYPEFSTNKYISGVHGKFTAVPGGWTLTDLGSTNGTFVNGSKLAPNTAVAIKRGDRIKIAISEFIVK